MRYLHGPIFRGSTSALVAILLVASVSACGGMRFGAEPTADELLSDAGARLTGAQKKAAGAAETLEKREKAVLEARDAVSEAQDDYAKAVKKRDKAREDLSEAQQQVEEARTHVSAAATDDALVGLVRKRITEDRKLRETAIDVAVADGIVTLSGTVPDVKTLDRAVDSVRAMPGVGGVDSRLTISIPTPAP